MGRKPLLPSWADTNCEFVNPCRSPSTSTGRDAVGPATLKKSPRYRKAYRAEHRRPAEQFVLVPRDVGSTVYHRLVKATGWGCESPTIPLATFEHTGYARQAQRPFPSRRGCQARVDRRLIRAARQLIHTCSDRSGRRCCVDAVVDVPRIVDEQGLSVEIGALQLGDSRR